MGCKATLGEICNRVCSGGTPKRKCTEYYDGGTIPWLNTKEIAFNRIYATESHITEEGLRNSAAKWINKDSVIIAMYGATAGKAALAMIPLTTNQACCNLEVNPAVADYRYVYYWIKNRYSFIANLANGGAQQNLSAKTIKALELNLPPLNLQHAVANVLAILDDKIELNNRLNGYLAALGEAIATRHSNEADGTLDDICNQSKEAVSFDSAQLETYVSTENLLPNKAGLQLSAGLPTSGKVTRYRKGDTLIANIRPYFKKIWYATDEGTCSGDVIVFRANDVRYAPYVFFSLFCDEFFKYVMLGAKGTKMPRGDKKQMMTFPICTNCNSTDLQLLHELASMIGTNHAESRQLARLRDVLLPELMSGEIDVSKVDLTQLNSHLADC